MTDREALAAFIEELRTRHAAGEFVGRLDWDLGELTSKDLHYRVGYWLARIDAFRAMSPAERHIWRGERDDIARGLRILRRRPAETAACRESARRESSPP